ncbi:rhomboid family-domain-containing protein, partial [Dichotomocladium elegans]
LLGEFIELSPLNVMFGPSIQVLVQSGARYPPCMRSTSRMPPDRNYICINTVLSFEPSTCSLQEICGFSGFSDPLKPDQAFRFFSPLFVHSGLLHCVVNLIALYWVAIPLERVINGWRFSALFFSTGIFGNVFGANFASPTTLSSGCSPATFGLLASLYIDLGFHWRAIQQPRRHAIKLVFGFVTLGLLPGIDSFSNLGGLFSGFLVSPSLVPCPQMRSRSSFILLWILRCVALGIIFSLLFVLIDNFYDDNGPRELCTYCHYLSCLPINGFCNQ